MALPARLAAVLRREPRARVGDGQDVVGAVAVGALGRRGRSPIRSTGRGCSVAYWPDRLAWQLPQRSGKCSRNGDGAGQRQVVAHVAGGATGLLVALAAGGVPRRPGRPAPLPPPWTLASSRSSMKRWHLPQVAATRVRCSVERLSAGEVDAVGPVAVRTGRRPPPAPVSPAPGRARSAGRFPGASRGSRRRSAIWWSRKTGDAGRGPATMVRERGHGTGRRCSGAAAAALVLRPPPCRAPPCAARVACSL